MSTLNYVGRYTITSIIDETKYVDHRCGIWLWNSSFSFRSFTISEFPNRNSSTPSRTCRLTNLESLRLHDFLGARSSSCQDWDPSLLLARLRCARISTARSFGRLHRPREQHGHLGLLHSPVQPHSSLLGRHRGWILHRSSGILSFWGQHKYRQRCSSPKPTSPASVEAQRTAYSKNCTSVPLLPRRFVSLCTTPPSRALSYSDCRPLTVSA